MSGNEETLVDSNKSVTCEEFQKGCDHVYGWSAWI